MVELELEASATTVDVDDEVDSARTSSPAVLACPRLALCPVDFVVCIQARLNSSHQRGLTTMLAIWIARRGGQHRSFNRFAQRISRLVPTHHSPPRLATRSIAEAHELVIAPGRSR